MPLRPRSRSHLTSVLAAVSLVSLFPPAAPAATKPAAKRSDAKPAPAGARRTPARKASAWTDRLTQFDNGPGVLICDPAPVEADAAAADFGAGCGRWLHLLIGGQGELGKTPRWSEQEITRAALSRGDLRLTTADLRKLAQRAGISLGITHVALGEISGSTSECSLSYQIWSVPGQKPVGAPLTLRGSAAEVVAQLPMATRGLCGALGITAPRIPEAVGESAEELQFLGSIPRVPDLQTEEAVLTQLATLAGRLSAADTGASS
jgi:hypothetical protein